MWNIQNIAMKLKNYNEKQCKVLQNWVSGKSRKRTTKEKQKHVTKTKIKQEIWANAHKTRESL